MITKAQHKQNFAKLSTSIRTEHVRKHLTVIYIPNDNYIIAYMYVLKLGMRNSANICIQNVQYKTSNDS